MLTKATVSHYITSMHTVIHIYIHACIHTYIHTHIPICMYIGKTVAECEWLCGNYGPDCKGFETYENHGGGGNGLVAGDTYVFIYAYIKYVCIHKVCMFMCSCACLCMCQCMYVCHDMYVCMYVCM